MENENYRYANFAVHLAAPQLLVSILEDHTNATAPSDVVNTFVTINTETVSIQPSGADFYAAPAFNSDGTRLAWIQWNHPDMPWDGAQVYVADVSISKFHRPLDTGIPRERPIAALRCTSTVFSILK
ncbi:hypothetical protein ACEPAH_9249 [Sanghuangporus vaninii]